YISFPRLETGDSIEGLPGPPYESVVGNQEEGKEIFLTLLRPPYPVSLENKMLSIGHLTISSKTEKKQIVMSFLTDVALNKTTLKGKWPCRCRLPKSAGFMTYHFSVSLSGAMTTCDRGAREIKDGRHRHLRANHYQFAPGGVCQAGAPPQIV